MRLDRFLYGASALGLCVGMALAQSDTDVVAPDVSVEGAGATVDAGAVDSADTSYAMSGSSYDIASGGGGSNVMRAISLLPGVDSPAIDPYGLASMVGSNKGVRIRGELIAHGNGAGALEGLPIMGVNPGPGNLFLIDEENLDSVQVFQGAIAPDHATTFTSYGVVNSHLKWPTKKAGAYVSQSMGENNFYRTALRADSGDLGADFGHLKMFASGSWTKADKWRGTGDAPNGKHNVSFGFSTHPVNGLRARLFLAYGDLDQDNYRGLTYTQIQDLKANRKLGYTSSSSSTASEAVKYQGYNRQAFTEYLLVSEFSYAPTEHLRFSVKPFYQHERGISYTGMSSGMIRGWLISHDSYGLAADVHTHLLSIDWTAGYWWSSQNLPGPPSAWKMYKPQADGTMKFAKWAILGKATGRHQLHNIYFMAGRDIGRLRIDLGARYIWQKIPGIHEYNTTGLTNTSYKKALKASSGIVGDRSVDGFTVGGFLPFISAKLQLADTLSLKVSSGRNYGASVFEVWPVFQQKYSAFSALGYTANDLWKKIRPETSVTTDVSLHWDFSGPLGEGYVEPLFFYSNFQHKSVVYNSGVGISYGQNVARTHAWGEQISAHYLPVSDLDLFFSVNHIKNVFGANLPTLSSASDSVVSAVAVKGKQLPDVPVWSGSVGATWHWHGFTLTPVVRFAAARYGDSAHTQKVPGYGVMDLSGRYAWKLPVGTMTTSLSLNNVFDKAYVGLISSSYYQSSSSGGIYFPGAARTLWGKVGFSL